MDRAKTNSKEYYCNMVEAGRNFKEPRPLDMVFKYKR
jgi:hypothetical protein